MKLRYMFDQFHITIAFILMAIGFILLFFVLLKASLAANPSLPFEERDCGTIGNVLSIAGHLRDNGMSEEEMKKQAAEALQECQKENGVDGCSVRNEAQQKFMESAFHFLWQNPNVDGANFATEFYEMCKKQANKVM